MYFTFEHYTSQSTPIFSNLKILKLHDLFQLKLLHYVYESVYKISPICFHDFFKSLVSVHEYGTRQAGKDDIFLTQKTPVNMVSDLYATKEQKAGMTFL